VQRWDRLQNQSKEQTKQKLLITVQLKKQPQQGLGFFTLFNEKGLELISKTGGGGGVAGGFSKRNKTHNVKREKTNPPATKRGLRKSQFHESGKTGFDSMTSRNAENHPDREKVLSWLYYGERVIDAISVLTNKLSDSKLLTDMITGLLAERHSEELTWTAYGEVRGL